MPLFEADLFSVMHYSLQRKPLRDQVIQSAAAQLLTRIKQEHTVLAALASCNV